MQMPESEDDAFGFGHASSTAKDKIRQIKPSMPADATGYVEDRCSG